MRKRTVSLESLSFVVESSGDRKVYEDTIYAVVSEVRELRVREAGHTSSASFADLCDRRLVGIICSDRVNLHDGPECVRR